VRTLGRSGNRVLACAASNTAADQLVSLLHQDSEIPLGAVVRLVPKKSHNRVSHSARKFSLDSLLESDDALRWAKIERPHPKDQEDPNWKGQTKRAILEKAKVVVCTCDLAGSRDLESLFFDVVVIDEAGQVLEPLALVPIAQAECSKIVFIGDHHQLGPFVFKMMNRNRTMLLRLAKEKNVQFVMLDTQYRMQPEIAIFSSNEFYEGKVILSFFFLFLVF
jgi:superfamily I DNA and/or RNA helicase